MLLRFALFAVLLVPSVLHAQAAVDSSGRAADSMRVAAITPKSAAYYPIVGYQYSGRHFGRIGIGREPRGGFIPFNLAIFVDVSPGTPLLIAPTLSLRGSGRPGRSSMSISPGLDLAYTTDMKRGGVSFRGTIDVAAANFRATYGYTIAGGSGLNQLGNHLFSIEASF